MRSFSFYSISRASVIQPREREIKYSDAAGRGYEWLCLLTKKSRAVGVDKTVTFTIVSLRGREALAAAASFSSHRPALERRATNTEVPIARPSMRERDISVDGRVA